jgi:light-regulated signal transduction histidine kinase (bacteriophytochrome)
MPKIQQDPKDKFWLLQSYEDGTFFMYEWTPILAKKPNMRPVKGDEAVKLLKLVRKGNNHVKFLGGKAREVVDESVKKAVELAEDKSITRKLLEENAKKAKAQAEATKNEEAPQINYSQGDILEMEVAAMADMRTRADVETHMLKKYQVEMPPVDKLGEMRQNAAELLEKLAKDDRLYLTDGRV